MKMPKMIAVMAAAAMLPGLAAWGLAGTEKTQTVAKLPGLPIKPLTIVYFRADPPVIQRGQASILKWKVAGASTVRLYREDAPLAERELGGTAPEDSVMVSPEETTSYILSAQGLDGEIMQSVTVHVTGGSWKIPRN